MKRFLLLLFLLFPLMVGGQDPKEGYHSPLEARLRLAGNFGELRPGHFHAGLDLKTWGRTGLPVTAIEKGEVSRIKIQEGGYGKALYIDHPDGNTSVYAHLERFAEPIRRFLRKVQYEHERGPIDLYPGEGVLKVERGETVAYSGNSGSSTAPHLHFEIRHTRSERPIDPLLFDFGIFDHRAPSFLGLRMIWPEGPKGMGNRAERTFRALRTGKDRYSTGSRDPIRLGSGGPVGFEVRALDRASGTHNPLGVQRIELFINDSSWFRISFDTLDFSKGGYIDAHIDHPYYYHRGRRYHRCHLLPNNELPIYEREVNGGWLDPKRDSLYRIRVEATDRSGNRSILRFEASLGERTSAPDSSWAERIPWNERVEFEREGIHLTFPKKSLFQDLKLDHERSDEVEQGRLSHSHQVHTPAIPLNRPIETRIELDSLPPGSRERLFIVSEDERWSRKTYEASYRDGRAVADVKRFGELSVRVDSTAPDVRPLRIRNELSQEREQTFSFRIEDGFSGIESYGARIGEQWRIPYYDRKTGTLRVKVSDPERPLPSGKREFHLKVRDRAGNERTFIKELRIEAP